MHSGRVGKFGRSRQKVTGQANFFCVTIRRPHHKISACSGIHARPVPLRALKRRAAIRSRRAVTVSLSPPAPTENWTGPLP